MPRGPHHFTAHFEDGRACALLEYFVDVDMRHAGGSATVTTTDRFTTDRGEPVDYVSQGRYTLVSTGEPLVSDDPNAP